jgi:hypothetical protein
MADASDPKPFPPAASAQQPAARRSQRTVMNDLAEIVAEAYHDEWTRWLREQSVKKLPDFHRERHWPAFLRLAKLFVDNQIVDYRTYIHVQFVSRANKLIAPNPQQCYGPVAESKWAAYATSRSSVMEQLKTALQIQRATLTRELSLEEDRVQDEDPPWTYDMIVGSVLCKPDLTFSALFRYGAATSAGLERVANEYREKAYLHYLFARSAYDRVWGDMIPADLRSRAAKELLELPARTEAKRGKR